MRSGLILLFLLLSACGQRGPLYLPDEQQPEAVMSTGDQSGETDEQRDWRDTDARPESDAGVDTGESDEEKDGKGKTSPPDIGRQD